MDPVRNPYSPGAGRKPAALVGRDEEQASWEVSVERLEGDRTAQSIVLYGLRGVGKTVLLSQFAQLAIRRDWVVATCEAGAGKSLRQALAEALHEPLVDIAQPSPGKRVLRALRTFLSFKATYDTAGTWSFGLDLKDAAGGGADTGILETDLTQMVRDLTAAAAEKGVGVAFLIDEAQDLSKEELTALCAVIHVGGQREWPLLVGLAGLPSLPRVLAEAKSYSERLFTYHAIERLAEPLATEALVGPARLERVTWEQSAAALVVAQTHGYPYFLQQYGQEAWNAADDKSRSITLTDARVGAANALSLLDTGFFRARWDRATKSEQQYLRAMAVDGDVGSSSGAVAGRMSRQATSLGPARAQLIQKGLVYAPDHGVVAFTVPGMADFILRQPQ